MNSYLKHFQSPSLSVSFFTNFFFISQGREFSFFPAEFLVLRIVLGI